MQEIRKQVRRARGRLILQQFVSILAWSLFATLLLAAVGLAIPKLWVLPVDANVWTASWAGGALGIGLVLALVVTYLVRRDSIDAAIEIDKRFGLKERVSSALALAPNEVDSEVGQALMSDAERRISRIDVRDEFKFRLTWKSWLPLLPAALVFALLVLPNASMTQESNATESQQKIEQAIKKSQEALRKKIEQKRKELADKGELTRTDDVFRKLEQNLNAMKKKKQGDVQKALSKLNDLRAELEKRRRELGGTEKLKKQLAALKNLQQGPADKMIKAIKRGDLKSAIKEIKKMQDRMKSGKMSEKDRKRLAKQLQNMQQKMQKMVQAHQKAKAALKKKIEQLQKQGKLSEAGKLQQQLNQMQQQDQQMSRMNKMAKSLGECAECLQKGQSGKKGQGQKQMDNAMKQLDKLSSQMAKMKSEMDDLATIDEVMDQIAEAKMGMSKGAGMNPMGNFGMSPQNMDSFGKGQGNGPGQGSGSRGLEKTDTKGYESQVRAKPKKGEAIVLGTADGPNAKGRTRQAITQRLRAASQIDADATENIRLPRDQADHTREYFNRLRKR